MELYTFGTPNGQKVTIALEELGASYTVQRIDISKGEQFSPEFLKINPNGKIPALVDGEMKVFESVAILIYLAEKYEKLLPKDLKGRYETLQWCIFQCANIGPMMGQFGHFKIMAKERIPYALERYGKETQRLFGVLDRQLSTRQFIAGDEFTIADISIWPWLQAYMGTYKEPIDADAFKNLMRWYREANERPAVKRGMTIC